MNKAGEERYSANWEKLSKKLRLLYSCACCGENEYSKKEVHHIDENKKNGSIENAIVLCKECHFLVHQKKQTIPDVKYENIHISVKTSTTLNLENWINKESKIELKKIPSTLANKFRKRHIKGWVKIGGCNVYIGMIVDGVLCGVLGFANQEMGVYDVLLKADTTPQNYKYSVDLLLYLLQTKQLKTILETKFNREIKNVYSMCFTKHESIARYRKHGEFIKKVTTEGGYNIGYLFTLGKYNTIKEAVSIFFQKHKDI